MSFAACAIIPTYNHHRDIAGVVSALRDCDLPVVIVDDGSTEPARTAITRLHDPAAGVHVARLPVNRGKGAAVLHGMRIADDMGFSHAVQVDADGQHDAAAIPRLLGLARDNPTSLVSGKPIYDDSVPRARRIGRWLTHVWVWIETLSLGISDSMCGFRVYPLRPCLDLAARQPIGTRMDFDTEIMVRLYWSGTPVVMTPVKVIYPPHNTSNFDMIADNWRITTMHVRLVLAMLVNLRGILRNRPRSATHWSRLGERGAAWGLNFLALLYRLLGKRFCLAMMQPVLLYFFLTGSEQRRASRDYLRRVGLPSGWWQSYAHFRSFGRMTLDKFAAWTGDMTPADLVFENEAEFNRVVKSGKGILLLVSHLGNVEVCRALSRQRSGIRITVLAHHKHAVRFNQLVARFNPGSAVDVLQVSEIGPATALDLQERLDRGDWVVIALDRTPVTASRRVSDIDFLGEPAPFSQGGLILASILKVPVYTMFCMKEDRHHRLWFGLFSERILLPRKSRDASLRAYLERYAGRLEFICRKYPYQWFNFYDFWRAGT
ncbi:glycosyltransferase family 2 protein [Microbulbifer sp. S227A]|uniref:glycosyltransferase family 2 protein n=1 Tax=Microbulbifer sp. S227A TaxID=3415131 RepID=UPI003C7DCA46